jgi:prophage regulatory protein
MSTSKGKRRAVKRQESIDRHRILRLREVVQRTGLPISSSYEAMRVNAFPGSVPIGLRAVGWVEDEIEAWIAARIAERDAKTAA